MSRSQAVLRGVLAAASLALVVTTAVASAGPLWLAVVLRRGLTGYVALRPGSHVGTVLVGGHALHWLVMVPLPDAWSQWLVAALAAVLLLVVQVSAALAAALPPQAPLPAGLVRRWVARTALVTAAAAPVWLVAVSVSRAATGGEVLFTYAALASAAVLALAVWLVAREPQT